MQVVWARPHVGEDQRPEVDDRQAVAVDRALSLLWDEVIHHAQEACGQEEAHRVMPIPPLHHRVLHPGIGRVGLEPASRNGGTVDQMQHRHRDDESPEEPVGDIDVAHLAGTDRAEENDGVCHPNQCDQDIDGPFQLRVFLALCVAHRQRDGCSQNDQLPTPEGERGQFVAE